MLIHHGDARIHQHINLQLRGPRQLKIPWSQANGFGWERLANGKRTHNATQMNGIFKDVKNVVRI